MWRRLGNCDYIRIDLERGECYNYNYNVGYYYNYNYNDMLRVC